MSVSIYPCQVNQLASRRVSAELTGSGVARLTALSGPHRALSLTITVYFRCRYSVVRPTPRISAISAWVMLLSRMSFACLIFFGVILGGRPRCAP